MWDVLGELDVPFAKTAYQPGDQVGRLQVKSDKKTGSASDSRICTARSRGEDGRWGDAYECSALQPDEGGEDVPEHRKQQDRFPPVFVRDYKDDNHHFLQSVPPDSHDRNETLEAEMNELTRPERRTDDALTQREHAP